MIKGRVPGWRELQLTHDLSRQDFVACLFKSQVIWEEGVPTQLLLTPNRSSRSTSQADPQLCQVERSRSPLQTQGPPREASPVPQEKEETGDRRRDLYRARAGRILGVPMWPQDRAQAGSGISLSPPRNQPSIPWGGHCPRRRG